MIPLQHEAAVEKVMGDLTAIWQVRIEWEPKRFYVHRSSLASPIAAQAEAEAGFMRDHHDVDPASFLAICTKRIAR